MLDYPASDALRWEIPFGRIAEFGKHMQRVGLLAGTAVVVAAGLLIGLYQAGDKTMPDWLFCASWVTLIGILVLGTPVWVFARILVPSYRFHRTRRYQWPIVSRTSPPLYKELLDMQDADRKNLLGCLRSSRDEVVFVDKEYVEPYLCFYITIWSSSVFTILVGTVTGQVGFDGKIFAQAIEDANSNWRAIKRKQPYRFELTQHIEPERTSEVRAAIEGGKITVDLTGLRYAVKIDEPDAHEIGAGFGWEPVTFTVMGK